MTSPLKRIYLTFIFYPHHFRLMGICKVIRERLNRTNGLAAPHQSITSAYYQNLLCLQEIMASTKLLVGFACCYIEIVAFANFGGYRTRSSKRWTGKSSLGSILDIKGMSEDEVRGNLQWEQVSNMLKLGPWIHSSTLWKFLHIKKNATIVGPFFDGTYWGHWCALLPTRITCQTQLSVLCWFKTPIKRRTYFEDIYYYDPLRNFLQYLKDTGR